MSQHSCSITALALPFAATMCIHTARLHMLTYIVYRATHMHLDKFYTAFLYVLQPKAIELIG